MQRGSNAADTGLNEAVQLEVIPPAHWWQRATYCLVEPVNVEGHTVPAGYITDGATVPRLIAVVAGLIALACHCFGYSWGVLAFVLIAVAVNYFPPVGKYLKAAIVHDWLLTGHEDGALQPEFAEQLKAETNPIKRRRLKDKEFLRIMVVLGINRVRRVIMYLAVRVNSLVKGVVGSTA